MDLRLLTTTIKPPWWWWWWWCHIGSSDQWSDGPSRPTYTVMQTTLHTSNNHDSKPKLN